MESKKKLLTLSNIKDLIRDTQRMIDKADDGQKNIEKHQRGNLLKLY